ncbi:MAG: hypothetical protein IH585_12250 [Anaerolineaceae bacterium]|nr:hypothetical protein [Anaerolineaceae bacterium]
MIPVIKKLMIVFLLLTFLLSSCSEKEFDQEEFIPERDNQDENVYEDGSKLDSAQKEYYETFSSALLPSTQLLSGFEFNGPLNEEALTPPPVVTSNRYVFEGRLELLNEEKGGHMQVLRGDLPNEFSYLPAFDFAFVQAGGYLIPVQRGIIVANHPIWNIILEPGRVWQESGDGEYSRAAIPFTLVPKGSNATFNGTLTFLFSDGSISKVWYQVTQETTTQVQANLWGLLDAVYHPEMIPEAARIRTDFEAEINERMPVKAIEDLSKEYPGIDVNAFGAGVSADHMTWYGVVVNGVNYVGGCQTRFGPYPFCESMRAASYSTAKSAFVSIAMMRLAQKYDVDWNEMLIKDYVPEYTSSAGDWENVTFNHAIDMSTGNYFSAGFMSDDESEKMGVFFGAQPYENRIKEAFSAPHKSDPGVKWVYRTSDTFILTRALHNFLQRMEGDSADIYQFVVDEIYQPLGIGPGFFTTMRTADNNWQGQAEGGYGQWWTPDDITRIGDFLLKEKGQVIEEQVLKPELLAASLHQDPDDGGVRIDNQRMYNNAFWATHFTESNGFDCEFWVPQMLGVSGNLVALFPNGITYYYFSDNDEFVYIQALRESNKIIPLCP